MTYEFKLPDIGEGVVEGEVVRWLVSEGEMVREDQPLVEIMTDKATVEIPAPKAGRIGKRMYAEGQICPVGKILVTIETGGAAMPAAPAIPGGSSPGPTVKSEKTIRAASVAVGPTTTGGDASRPSSDPVLATPATRKLARDLGVDIRQVGGSGRAGRITSADVHAHQARAGGSGTPPVSAHAPMTGFASPKHEAGDVRLPFRGVRKKIAERLVHSKHTAAHFTYVEEIDCTDLVAVRVEANRRLSARGGKLSDLPFIIRATVAALEKFPQLNATLDELAGEIVQRASHHIGLATATDSGLIVPVIRDAGRKSLVELGTEIERLAEATRSGKATRDELAGSTFTITSLGALGGLLATPIINFPEVAILGVHKIAKRPAAVGDRIELRHLMNLSISVDHRVVDGYDAARFVAEIKSGLENPAHFLVGLGEEV
jgi:pyruvate dehydrogenase E2 component (dihydrolipoamide acetyltransferase)